MKCLCGHQETIEQRASVQRGFAVIPDSEYQRFLRLEQKVMEATTPEAHITAIAKSAQLVGSLRICPECARLTFLHPGGKKVGYYQLESEEV